MAYATAEQFIARYDVRKLGQLVRDNNSQATEAELLSDVVLSDALEDASAQIRSAATIANHYTLEDLDGLATDGDPFLIKLTCDLAMGGLIDRRSLGNEITPAVERAENWLAALRLGEKIFNLPATRRLGNLQHHHMTNAKWSEANNVADMNRYFPVRGQGVRGGGRGRF